MRKFVVGDLHGNYLGLMQCLEKVKFNDYPVREYTIS